MACILQQFVHRCDKWVACCGRWESGGSQAPKISMWIWQVSIGLYQWQNRAKLSRLNY